MLFSNISRYVSFFKHFQIFDIVKYSPAIPILQMKIGMITGNTGTIRSGIGNYTYHLTTRLKDKTGYSVSAIAYDDTPLVPGLPTIIPYYPIVRYNSIVWSRVISLQTKRFSDLDIVHNPGHYPLMKKMGRRMVSTIHDLTPVIHPAWHQIHRVISSKLLFPKLIRDSDRIIADSHNTKKDIMWYYGINDEKISVIHLGASEQYQPLAPRYAEDVREKYHLDFPFLLFVGTLEPRKNLPTLLKAFAQVKEKNRSVKLVIAGQKGWNYSDIFTTIAHLHIEKEVVFLNYVTHDDLPALYNAAEVFVYPSLYEGFGLPPLEAMQCGIPVITSDTSSLPEIMGDGGIMVNPFDTGAFAEKISLLLEDDRERKENIRYNLARAGMFSWDRCARETAEVYDEIYSGKS